jgi:hypothetical protein
MNLLFEKLINNTDTTMQTVMNSATENKKTLICLNILHVIKSLKF